MRYRNLLNFKNILKFVNFKRPGTEFSMHGSDGAARRISSSEVADRLTESRRVTACCQ